MSRVGPRTRSDTPFRRLPRYKELILDLSLLLPPPCPCSASPAFSFPPPPLSLLPPSSLLSAPLLLPSPPLPPPSPSLPPCHVAAQGGRTPADGPSDTLHLRGLRGGGHFPPPRHRWLRVLQLHGRLERPGQGGAAPALHRPPAPAPRGWARHPPPPTGPNRARGRGSAEPRGQNQ